MSTSCVLYIGRSLPIKHYDLLPFIFDEDIDSFDLLFDSHDLALVDMPFIFDEGIVFFDLLFDSHDLALVDMPFIFDEDITFEDMLDFSAAVDVPFSDPPLMCIRLSDSPRICMRFADTPPFVDMPFMDIT
jgi:hypothetical protein